MSSIYPGTRTVMRPTPTPGAAPGGGGSKGGPSSFGGGANPGMLTGGSVPPRPAFPVAPMVRPPTPTPAPAAYAPSAAAPAIGTYTPPAPAPAAAPAGSYGFLTGATTGTAQQPAAAPVYANTPGFQGKALNANQIAAYKRSTPSSPTGTALATTIASQAGGLKARQGNQMGSWTRAADGSFQFQPFDPNAGGSTVEGPGWNPGGATGPRQRRRSYSQMTSPGIKMPQSAAEAQAMGRTQWYNSATNQMVNL